MEDQKSLPSMQHKHCPTYGITSNIHVVSGYYFIPQFFFLLNIGYRNCILS